MSKAELEHALTTGRARTRDGRLVFYLRRAVIDDGTDILIGRVSTKARYKDGEVLLMERHYWRGTWGVHGGDDLVACG